MAKYAEITDAVDYALRIEQRHIDDADIYLDAELAKRGFNPAVIESYLPIQVLTRIAALMALRQACIEQAMGEDTQLQQKVEKYQMLIDQLLDSLNQQTLGLSDDDMADSEGFGSVTVALI